MALVVKDRVKVYSSTTGTGTLSLGSAFAGFQTFNNALGDGDTTYYGIFESSTGNWEVGLGTYTSSGNTLSRDTILESSNAGAAVNLTADTEVFITYPAEKSVYFDANGDVNLNRDPQSALQAATKQYVDTIAAAGIHYHDPVRVESPDTAGSLNATYDNGSSGVGATLTNAGTQAALVIDGVTVATNDRVLIYNQTNAYENGVYTVTNTGSASTNWVLTRATDADSYGPSDPDSFGQGDAFFVKEGDTGAGELYVMNTAGEIVFGTTAINFIVVAETAVYSAGNGLSLSGTEFSVGAGTGITVSATTVSTVQDIATSATPTFAGLNTTADITFGDNDKAIFGAGSDLQIYHDGSHSYVTDQGTGRLYLQGTANITLTNADGTAEYANFANNGAVSLRYNNLVKFATTSTGIDVTGNIDTSGSVNLDADNYINWNDGSTDAAYIRYVNNTTSSNADRLDFYHSSTSGGTAGYVQFYANGTSRVIIDSDETWSTERYTTDAGYRISASRAVPGAPAPTVYLDITQTTFDAPDNFKILLGTGDDLQIYHDGTGSKIYDSGTGNLQILGDSDVYIANANNSEYKARFITDGAVELFYDSVKKFETTSTGIDVTGTVTADGLTVDNGAATTATIGRSSNADDSSNLFLKKGYNGSSKLDFLSSANDNSIFRINVDSQENVSFDWDYGSAITNDKNISFTSDATKTHLNISTTGDISFYEDTGTTAQFFWDASAERLGIGDGTNTPPRTLHLKNDVPSIRLTDSTANDYAEVVSTDGDLFLRADHGNTHAGSRLSLQVDGTDALYIDDSLNIGIGTTSPSFKQHTVVSGATGDLAAFALGGNINNPTLVIKGDANNQTLTFRAGSNTGTYPAITFDMGTTGEAMRIDSSGNVVIGGTDASYGKFSVRNGYVYINEDGINTKQIYIRSDLGGDPAIQVATNHALGFRTNNAERMRIDSSGNVGIGEASPASKLHVLGMATFETDMSSQDDWANSPISIYQRDGHSTSDNRYAPNLNFHWTGVMSRSLWMAYDGTLYYGEYDASGYPTTDKIWHSGNDGSGSGLDADTVDGLQASSFLRSDAVDYASNIIVFEDGVRVGTGSGHGTAGRATISFGEGNPTTDTFFIEYDGDNLGGDANALIFRNGNIGEQLRLEYGGAIKFTGRPTASGNIMFDQGNLIEGTSFSGTYPVLFGVDDTTGRVFENNNILYNGTTNVLTISGNTVWHGGNTGTVLTNRGTGTDITSNDWNDYINGTEASWVRVVNMSGSNRPPNYTYGTALNFSYSTSGKFQLYASHTGSAGNGLYFRTGWNTDYKGWAKIYDSVAHPALGYVDTATGNYGTIKVDDDRGVTWAGYAIRDDWVFMGNGAAEAGIYNDTDNEWAIKFFQNGQTSLYYNGSGKLSTTSGGVAVTGALTATGDITAYFSDERLKDFDGKIEGALDKVSQLNGYYYRENDKAKELGFENDDRQVGVSAQEVEAVLPEVIKPAPVDPEYKTVQYEKLVPLLIEAIKELKEEVRQLKEDKA